MSINNNRIIIVSFFTSPMLGSATIEMESVKVDTGHGLVRDHEHVSSAASITACGRLLARRQHFEADASIAALAARAFDLRAVHKLHGAAMEDQC